MSYYDIFKYNQTTPSQTNGPFNFKRSLSRTNTEIPHLAALAPMPSISPFSVICTIVFGNLMGNLGLNKLPGLEHLGHAGLWGNDMAETTNKRTNE